MLCGDPVALSVIVTVAVIAPVAAGAKWPWIVQLAPTARLAPQLLANTNEEASVPVTAMLVIVRAAVPVLVMVTDCDELAVPTFVAGKARLFDESLTGPDDNPVPLSDMLCGEVLALSVILMVAVSAPVTVGAKCPWIVQFTPIARLVPQVLANTNEEAFVPATVMLVMATAAVPVLVTVTDCEKLDEPTSTEPNERLVADRVTGGTTPVPLNAIACGEVLALSVMVMDAVNAPPAAGAKCPWIVQLVPAATLVPQVFANTKEDASVPVTAILVTDSGAVPGLVSVTDCDPLDEPTNTEPKERLVAESKIGGSTPVPPNSMVCGELPALSVIVMVADKALPAVGAKCPWMEQFAPAARLVPQLFAKTNEDAFVPDRAMLLIETATLPVLVIVTD